VHLHFFIRREQFEAGGKRMRLRHGDADVIADEVRANGPREGLKRDPILAAGKPSRKTRKAARAIAAHLRLAAIGVVVTHLEIRPIRRWLHRDETVCTDAAVTIAQTSNRRAVQRVAKVAVVEHDEVIPGSVHLGERQGRHVRKLDKPSAWDVNGAG
jgi:hypothetical protein